MNREPMTRDEIFDIVRRVQSGEDRKDIAARYGITRSTISNYMRRYGLIRDDRAERGPRRTVAHEWMEDAACVDPETRLPRRVWDEDRLKYHYFTEWHVQQQAKVCRDCPVKAECREFGRRFAASAATWRQGTGPVFGALPPPKMAELRKGQAA